MSEMRRWGAQGTALALVLGLMATACGSEDDDGGAADARADVAPDARDTDPSVDLAPDTAAPDADAVDQSDVSAESGVIRGDVFNNSGDTEGTLIVGLVTEVPIVGEPVRSIVIDDPSAPAQPYEFVEVPLGAYHVAALLDRGEPSTLEEPGVEDLFGVTASPVGLESDGEERSGINVEVQ